MKYRKLTTFRKILFFTTVVTIFSCRNSAKEQTQIKEQFEDSIIKAKNQNKSDNSVIKITPKVYKKVSNTTTSNGKVSDVTYKLSNIRNYGKETDFKWEKVTVDSNGISFEGVISKALKGVYKKGEAAGNFLLVEKIVATSGKKTFFTFVEHFAEDQPVITFIRGNSTTPTTINYYSEQSGENWTADLNTLNLPWEK